MFPRNFCTRIIWLIAIFSSGLIIASEGYLFYLFTSHVNELKSHSSWVQLLCKYRTTADITDELRNVLVYRRKNNTLDISDEYIDVLNRFSDSLLRQVGINPITGKNYSYGTGYAFKLLKAYHSRPVEDSNYHWMFKFAGELRRLEINLEEDYHYRDDLKNFAKNCNNSLLTKEKVPGFSKLDLAKVDYYNTLADKNVFKYQCIYSRSQRIFETKTIPELILSVYRDSCVLFCSYAELSIDFEKFGVNGRDNSQFKVSSILRQYIEGKELREEVRTHFKELNALKSQAETVDAESAEAQYYQAEVQRFFAMLTTSPIGDLFLSQENWDNRRNEVIKWLRAFKGGCKFFLDDYRSGKYNMLEAVNENLEQIYAQVDVTRNFFGTRMDVRELQELSDDLHEMWDWKITKSPMHSLRVAWNLLDKVNEELKCVLHKSYWQDVRNETLKKTQLDLLNASIYSQISRTLYQPCRTTDTDLIGVCTAENHEICRPMIPSRHQQRYINNEDELSIYKPKWVFTRVSTGHGRFDVKCEPLLTYVIGVNICQCGFIDDCARDLGRELKCPLQDVGDLRQQCKGSIGYPCKSLPLAPGRYDESCVTGYCHMRLNSCEDDVTVYPAVHLNNNKGEKQNDSAIFRDK